MPLVNAEAPYIGTGLEHVVARDTEVLVSALEDGEVIDSDSLEHVGTTFWYLKNISIVLVKRDREWFQTSFHRIKQFWDAVEDARINGIPEKKKKEKETKFDMSQFTGSAAANKPKDFVADFNNDGSAPIN